MTTVSMPAMVGTSNSGVLACGGTPAVSTASRAFGVDSLRLSSRACMRHARHAVVTKNCQSQTYTPRTPLEPPELNTC